jgi:hypothetical protein
MIIGIQKAIGMHALIYRRMMCFPGVVLPVFKREKLSL